MNSKYQPLSSEDRGDYGLLAPTTLRKLTRKFIHSVSFKLLLLQLLNIICFATVWFWKEYHSPSSSPIDGSGAVERYLRLQTYSSISKFSETEFSERNANQSLWLSLYPEGEGIVTVSHSDPLSRLLPPSAPSPTDPNSSMYQLSVFHQLHCLEMVKIQLETGAKSNSALQQHKHGHALHCIDWIRQALMCNADSTLDPTKDYIEFGDGNVHQCRDFDAIFKWTHENRFRGPVSLLKGGKHEGQHDHIMEGG